MTQSGPLPRHIDNRRNSNVSLANYTTHTLHACVCFVCMYVCMYVCTYANMYLCMVLMLFCQCKHVACATEPTSGVNSRAKVACTTEALPSHIPCNMNRFPLKPIIFKQVQGSQAQESKLNSSETQVRHLMEPVLHAFLSSSFQKLYRNRSRFRVIQVAGFHSMTTGCCKYCGRKWFGTQSINKNWPRSCNSKGLAPGNDLSDTENLGRSLTYP